MCLRGTDRAGSLFDWKRAVLPFHANPGSRQGQVYSRRRFPRRHGPGAGRPSRSIQRLIVGLAVGRASKARVGWQSGYRWSGGSILPPRRTGTDHRAAQYPSCVGIEVDHARHTRREPRRKGAGAPSLRRQHGMGETGILSTRATGRDRLTSFFCKRMLEQAVTPVRSIIERPVEVAVGS
jgi:hypothetical protein